MTGLLLCRKKRSRSKKYMSAAHGPEWCLNLQKCAPCRTGFSDTSSIASGSLHLPFSQIRSSLQTVALEQNTKRQTACNRVVCRTVGQLYWPTWCLITSLAERKSTHLNSELCQITCKSEATSRRSLPCAVIFGIGYVKLHHTIHL